MAGPVANASRKRGLAWDRRSRRHAGSACRIHGRAVRAPWRCGPGEHMRTASAAFAFVPVHPRVVRSHDRPAWVFRATGCIAGADAWISGRHRSTNRSTNVLQFASRFDRRSFRQGLRAVAYEQTCGQKANSGDMRAKVGDGFSCARYSSRQALTHRGMTAYANVPERPFATLARRKSRVCVPAQQSISRRIRPASKFPRQRATASTRTWTPPRLKREGVFSRSPAPTPIKAASATPPNSRVSAECCAHRRCAPSATPSDTRQWRATYCHTAPSSA